MSVLKYCMNAVCYLKTKVNNCLRLCKKLWKCVLPFEFVWIFLVVQSSYVRKLWSYRYIPSPLILVCLENPIWAALSFLDQVPRNLARSVLYKLGKSHMSWAIVFRRNPRNLVARSVLSMFGISHISCAIVFWRNS